MDWCKDCESWVEALTEVAQDLETGEAHEERRCPLCGGDDVHGYPEDDPREDR